MDVRRVLRALAVGMVTGALTTLADFLVPSMAEAASLHLPF